VKQRSNPIGRNRTEPAVQGRTAQPAGAAFPAHRRDADRPAASRSELVGLQPSVHPAEASFCPPKPAVHRSVRLHRPGL